MRKRLCYEAQVVLDNDYKRSIKKTSLQRNTVGYVPYSLNQMILEKGARIRGKEEKENGLIQCKIKQRER